MIPRRLAPLAVFAALCASGCATRILDFTVISTKNVDIPGTRGAKVEGEDMKSIIIIVPTGQPSVKEAVDRALEKGDADVLLDGVIYMKQWYIPYIYGQAGYVVDGTAMRTSPPGTAPVKRAPAVAPAPPAPTPTPAPVETSVAPAAAAPAPAAPAAPAAQAEAPAPPPATPAAPKPEAPPPSKPAAPPPPGTSDDALLP
jgi:hypothetical protein